MDHRRGSSELAGWSVNVVLGGLGIPRGRGLTRTSNPGATTSMGSAQHVPTNTRHSESRKRSRSHDRTPATADGGPAVTPPKAALGHSAVGARAAMPGSAHTREVPPASSPSPSWAGVTPGSSASAGASTTTAAKEALRAKALKRIRSVLHRECTKAGARPPLLCVERWLFRAAAQTSSRHDPGLPSDPVIPPRACVVDPTLLRDLQKIGISSGEAQRIVTKMAAVAFEEATSLGRTDEGVAVDADAAAPVSCWRVGREVRFSADPSGKPYVCCTQECHQKLATLWHTHAGSTLTGAAQTAAMEHDMYCVLARYHTVSGEGYQAALPVHPFRVLQERLGVQCECFASPLNSTLDQFHSAFQDTDGVFGSRGSFFAASLETGSYEANPPFVPEVMSAMVTRMDRLLDVATDNGASLAFTVFVPAWEKVRAWGSLTRSRHLVRTFTLGAEEHAYVDGAQHRSTERHRPSSFGTGVFILQSTAARRRWPVDDSVVDDLKAAMVGTAKLLVGVTTIADWEKRVHRTPSETQPKRSRVERDTVKDQHRTEWAAFTDDERSAFSGSWRKFVKARRSAASPATS